MNKNKHHRKRAPTYRIVWVVLLAGILLIIAIPNGTTEIVFGQWPAYLIFIGVVVGLLFAKPKVPSTKLSA